MKILEQFENLEKYTVAEQSIIACIMENKRELRDLTIRELASKSYSSNASIIRLCRKLGFEGYREFVIEFMAEMEAEKYTSSDVNYTIPFRQDESTEEIVTSIFSLYREGINVIHSKLDMKVLEGTARCIQKSKRCFIFAAGDSQITARAFINKLSKINYFPILASEYYEHGILVENIDEADCAMFITYSGNRVQYEKLFKILMKKKTPTIVLTANESCLLSKRATYCFCMPDLERDGRIATYFSQFGFTYYLNLIYSLIYYQGKKN